MARGRLHIDRLELRLRGVNPALGRALEGELRQALEQNLAGVVGPYGRTRRMDALRLEPVKLASGASGREVAASASSAIGRSLRGLARGG
ncbi:MAG: hypothetical protein MI920_14840 [Kiloniellales bacterium]|nr:hypothetical protein [Kiloniellales bacterium]